MHQSTNIHQSINQSLHPPNPRCVCYPQDERYMATNDMCVELAKDAKMDEMLERRVCAAVLKQLNDASNDVQSVAVKCLAVLTKVIQAGQVGEVVTKLLAAVTEGKAELRDIYSIGLKTLIADVPGAMGAIVADSLGHKLIATISKSASDDVKREALDNLTDLLTRFGHLLSKEHEHIMSVVVLQLESDKVVVCKRASACLGALAVVSEDSLLDRMVRGLFEMISGEEAKKGKRTAYIRTLLQTIGAISRTVGFRLGRYLALLVPLFLRFCGDVEDEDQHTDGANELREHCFPGLESFVLRCPAEVAEHLPAITAAALAFAAYDPNYSYNDDDGEDAMECDAAAEEQYDDEEDAGSDDDDTSWKVRKAAVKVLAAIVTSRPDMVDTTYSKCADVLVARFKEREENVRLDVVACYTELLVVVGATSAASASAANGAAVGSSSATLAALQAGVPQVVSALGKQFATGVSTSNVKTKSALFIMMKALTQTLHGGLDAFLELLIAHVQNALADKSQTLKLDALGFLKAVLENHSSAALTKSVGGLLPIVIKASHEEWYKIIAEALRVITLIVTVLCPLDPTSADCVVPIFNALRPRLEGLDIDQEIKECAVLAVAALLAHWGDKLPDQLAAVLPLLRKRLENESYRVSTLKAIVTIASSPLRLSLGSHSRYIVSDACQYLRQHSRLLRQASLITLDALLSTQAAGLSQDDIVLVLKDAANFVTDSDLHLAQLALVVVRTCLLSFRTQETLAHIRSEVYPRALDLASSQQLQEPCLGSLVQLLQLLIASDSAAVGVRYEELVDALSARCAVQGQTRRSIQVLAKCVAGTVMAAPSAQQRTASLERFAAELSKQDEHGRQVALFCLGELGHLMDVPAACPKVELKTLVLACLEKGAEETRLAAAYALGHVAVGNMAQFLPLILQSTEVAGIRCLSLLSLKETVTVHANACADFSPYLDRVLPLLLREGEGEDDNARQLVSECTGTLAAMNADRIVPVLTEMVATKTGRLNHLAIASAVRFCLSRRLNADNASLLRAAMPSFLSLLSEADLEVRRAVLMMVNAAMHHNPQIIAPWVAERVLPRVIETLVFKLERSVDLGPFKHKVDDGLPLRKLAITCIETMFDNIPDQFDVGAVMGNLPSLLSDTDEIKAQAHQIIIKLSTFAPPAVVASADIIVEPLEKTITKKPKEGAVGPELERANELVRSALRAVDAMSSIRDMASSKAFGELLERIKKDPALSEIIAASKRSREGM